MTTAVEPIVDAETCWQALVEDSIATVCVLDEDGRVLYVNSVAARVVRDAVTNPVGRTLHEIHDRAYADERLGFIRSAIETDKPVVYDMMHRGVAWRTVIRPIPGYESPRRVLTVGRPAAGPDLHRVENPEVFRARVHDMGPLEPLTPRELEVLGMIGEGLTTSQMAERLARSTKTVEGHRIALGAKLNVTNRVELARIAIRAGLCRFDAAEHEPHGRLRNAC